MSDDATSPESMPPAIHVVTLGVSDLERSIAFYRDGLGLATTGVIGTEFVGDENTAAGAIATFTLDTGLILSLYPGTELAKDSGTDIPTGASAMSLGQIVDSREGGRSDPAARGARRRHDARRGPRAPVGHLLRVLRRPGPTPLGDHLLLGDHLRLRPPMK